MDSLRNKNVNRTPQREEKIAALKRKLGEDKYHWAFEIQQKPFPSWSAAFEYAYQLGLERGKRDPST